MPIREVHRVLAVLADLGYVVETDWRPVRVELVAPGRGRVDVHPIDFDSAGDGVQQGLDSAVFRYPAACLTSGTIAGRTVPCLSVARQVQLHGGSYAGRRARSTCWTSRCWSSWRRLLRWPP